MSARVMPPNKVAIAESSGGQDIAIPSTEPGTAMSGRSMERRRPLLLTLQEAAAELRISTTTLREHVRHGEIPFISLGRGEKRKRRMFDLADLQAFVAARREREPCPSTSPATARITTTISNIAAYDFTALQEQRRAEKLNASKSRSGRKPRTSR